MMAANCLDMAASMALMPWVIVRVTSLLQVSVPLRASSVSVLIRSAARSRSVCLVAAMACSSRLPSATVVVAAALGGLFGSAHYLSSLAARTGIPRSEESFFN